MILALCIILGVYVVGWAFSAYVVRHTFGSDMGYVWWAKFTFALLWPVVLVVMIRDVRRERRLERSQINGPGLIRADWLRKKK